MEYIHFTALTATTNVDLSGERFTEKDLKETRDRINSYGKFAIKDEKVVEIIGCVECSEVTEKGLEITGRINPSSLKGTPIYVVPYGAVNKKKGIFLIMGVFLTDKPTDTTITPIEINK